MATSTISRRKLPHRAAQRIKELIAAQRLQPGDRLPTESELAQALGMSRLSVREATKALEFLGIVAAKPGVGLTVGQVDWARMTDHLAYLPAVNQAGPLELIDSRVVIETGALPHLARRMQADPAIYLRLAERVEAFRSARDLARWIELDLAFHRALLEESGLAPLVAVGDLLQVFFQRFRASVKRAEWKRGIESHRRIVDLLAQQQLVKAVSELRGHIESHKERIELTRRRPKLASRQPPAASRREAV